MKTLILLLLLAVSGQMFGQNDSADFEYERAYPYALEGYYIDSNKNHYDAYLDVDNYIEKVTTELILEYAEECYNDSTYCKVNISQPGSLVYSYTWRWIHKEPTFKGFINWLEGRK